MGMTANVSAHAEAQGGVTRWVGCDRSFRPSCSINTARMTWGWVKLGYFMILHNMPSNVVVFVSSIMNFRKTIHINPYHPFVKFSTHPHISPLVSSVDHCIFIQANSALAHFPQGDDVIPCPGGVHQNHLEKPRRWVPAAIRERHHPASLGPKPLQSSLVCCSIKSEKKRGGHEKNSTRNLLLG